MSDHPLTSAMLQARDIILQCLLVRKGALLTEMVCRERANNCAQALMELLEPLAAEDEPPPVRRPPVEDDELANLIT